MPRLLNPKKYLILTIFLSACAQPVVKCHHWTPQEKAQLKQQVAQIPDNTPLDGEVRDYERLCSQL